VETGEGVHTRESLHRLVDALPAGNLSAAKAAIEPLADPFLAALANAPVDDEPESEDERAAVAEAVDDLTHDRVRPWDDVRRELSSG
jgi:hypothetical protein